MKRQPQFLTALILTLFLIGTSSAFAVSYELKESTTEVLEAIKGRQERYAGIQHLKSEGVIGETNKGYLETLKPIPEADTLVSAENASRKAIYEAIVAQNNLGPAGMIQVQRVFAEVQREKSRPGDPIQLPSGEWAQK